jgi:hypothetical protein
MCQFPQLLSYGPIEDSLLHHDGCDSFSAVLFQDLEQGVFHPVYLSALG